MKTKYFIFAAIAAVGLVGCTNDDFVGNLSPNVVEETTVADNGIRFGGGFKAITRADKVGADAADLLNNEFVVLGMKGDGVVANMTKVFDNYSVIWAQNTAGTTESNTSDWEYVGKTNRYGLAGSQAIKYWDFSANYYDFAAFSTGKATIVADATGTATGAVSSGSVRASKITYSDASTGGYTLEGARDDLAKCYITDMKTVAKADYKKEVTMEFRSLASKVRIALYETVPGYSVENVHFYDNDATTTAVNATITNTIPTIFGSDNTAFYTSGKYTVTFPTIGIANNGKTDYNKAHVAITGNAGVSSQTFGTTLVYTSDKTDNEPDGSYLKRSSQDPSFAGTDPYYVTVLPNENGNVLELRVNYTLVSTDGTGEKITVHGAKAFVPALYTKWLPNYAYTYIFKISDNTNGLTDPSVTDQAGLFPITFDAVVLDPIDTNKEQTTITTVAMPSITTYQKGHIYNQSNEYKATASLTDSIYVQVMCGDPNNASAAVALRTDLNTKGSLYTVTGTTISEAAVMDALNIYVSSSTSEVVGRNGITLTKVTSDYAVADGSTTFGWIPAIDGNNTIVAANTAARFKASAGTYAFVYDATPTSAPASTYIYSAVHFDKGAAQPSDWTGNYWDNPNGTGSAVGTFDSSTFDATNGQTYYRRWEDHNKIYGVKVIKVQ